jgi:glycosyltransferase involved in cell wall biosynthesis
MSSRKNLLFVVPYLPGPPEFGAQRRTHGLMTDLAKRHDVSLLALTNRSDRLETQLKATREYCREVIAIDNEAFALGQRGKRLLQLRSLASPKSFEWHTHSNRKLTAKLHELVARERWDAVTFEFSQMAPHREGLGPGASPLPPFLLDEHNIEFEILRRTAASESGAFRKLYNAVNAPKLRAEELRAWKLFDATAVTSAVDEAMLKKEQPDALTSVIPNAVDLEQFLPSAQIVEPDSLIFFGAMNYFPNSDGLHFFVREVMPLLLKLRPAVKLRVVGHTPDALKKLESESVQVIGFVPDVRAHIANAAVAIAPLRVGGGTRLKILEAMAMGKAIVSTRVGAEGLDVQHDRDCLLADDPARFAAEIARPLVAGARRARLGIAARRLAEEQYGWPATARKLEALYELMAARRAR